MPFSVRVELPPWLPLQPLLGPGAWRRDETGASAELDARDAADLAARLRGVALGGRLLAVDVTPALPRAAVRAARTEDARRRRETSPGFTRKGAQLDEEGRYSLTPEAIALAMGAPLRGRRVVDATCGAGGNTIGFARAGAEVVAVERHAGRLEMARANARLYGVASRVRFVAGDARAVVGGLTGDVLFVDPPWGVDWNRARTGLADVPPLADLLAAGVHFSEIWAKLPPSFDTAEWPGARPEAVFGVAAGDARRVKFLLLKRSFVGAGDLAR